MINRKVLYGYQIQNGALEIVPEEQRAVSMVFTLYNAGASYQAISDALNRQGIPYCREVPLWNKHKVKRLLENPRYTGKEGYPILVEADIFQAAQEKTAEKNARKQSHGEKPAIARLTPYFRCACGGKMTRLGGGWQNSGKLYLRCEGCGNTAVMHRLHALCGGHAAGQCHQPGAGAAGLAGSGDGADPAGRGSAVCLLSRAVCRI